MCFANEVGAVRVYEGVTTVAALCHSTGNSGRVGSGRYWTLASARVLRLPSIAVQVFRTYLGSSGPRKHGTRELGSRVGECRGRGMKWEAN